MTTQQQEKDSSQEKRQRIENIKLLLSKTHHLKSAQEVCDAYSKEYAVSIPLPSMSRYLSSADFDKGDDGYRVTIKDEEIKKSQTLSSLLADAHAHIINDYEILFIGLTNDFSTTIAHYLENHPPIAEYILSIIPHKKSLMIFCHTGYKETIEKAINQLLL